jgi:hypothetical protein
MYYAPHILQKRVDVLETTDEFGRPIESKNEDWATICKCRCDINTYTELEDENGKIYKPDNHIVCEQKSLPIDNGDYVRVLSGEEIKCEGKVLRPHKLNYLNYAEFWV